MSCISPTLSRIADYFHNAQRHNVIHNAKQAAGVHMPKATMSFTMPSKQQVAKMANADPTCAELPMPCGASHLL